MNTRIVIVGRGSLGRSLARALVSRGCNVSTTSGRHPSVQRLRSADVVVLAVPDPAIARVAERIAPAMRPGTVALHVAGARTCEELRALERASVATGVMHPLVSFARGTRARSFEGTAFVLDGAPKAVRAASRLAKAVGARPVHARVHGPAYHATAALVANGAVALVNEAGRVLASLGVDERVASSALAGLLESVATNVRRVGVPEALTGPIARGDAATVAAHRHALGAISADALATYDGVAPATLRCSVARGLDAKAAREVARAIDAEPTTERARPTSRSKRRSPRRDR